MSDGVAESKPSAVRTPAPSTVSMVGFSDGASRLPNHTTMGQAEGQDTRQV